MLFSLYLSLFKRTESLCDRINMCLLSSCPPGAGGKGVDQRSCWKGLGDTYLNCEENREGKGRGREGEGKGGGGGQE